MNTLKNEHLTDTRQNLLKLLFVYNYLECYKDYINIQKKSVVFR